MNSTVTETIWKYNTDISAPGRVCSGPSAGYGMAIINIQLCIKESQFKLTT